MDVITAIKKERGKYRVIVNDCEHVLVPISLMRERPLKEGQPLDLEEYDNWLMVRQYRFALDRAVGYLAARARSRREIEQKLLQAGYRPCTVEMVIYKLQRENLLDDADFAFCPGDAIVAKRYPNVCNCADGAVADVIYKKIPEILK